ncbi:MAG TPA: hypothetical protein DDW93_04560, partial [Firmicutes bacterium]|nr:hypothetical protein [Bacillota bacterium]
MKKNASNSKDVKTYNRILIRNIIRKLGPIARYELAKETGLTPPTVTVIVNEFIEDGIVHEVGFGESSGGRRPVMLELNSKAAFIFAVRLQRDEVVTALFDIGGNILNQNKRTLDTSVAEDVVEAVGNSYDWLIENTGIDKEKVLCCGLASPGLINTHRGLIQHSSNLKWDKVPLGAMLSKRLYGIPVHVENISNAAALAEKEYGSGRGYHDLIYLNLSVGIGAGFIIGGEIYGGTRGYAGEIGHMTLMPDGGPECACGRLGCLEAICGVRAITERMKRELPDWIFEEYGVNKIKLNMSDLFLPSIVETKEVRMILTEVGRWVGITVANLVSIFNPELIILGGELPKAGGNFIEAVVEEMNKSVLKEFVGTVKVVRSKMKEDPPL